MQHAPKFDNHSHILQASIESMVEAAARAEVSRLSITEHISQFSFVREKGVITSVHESGRMFTSFEEYLSEFPKVRGKNPQVRNGLEVDFIEAHQDFIGKHVSKFKWDVLLCSVHELADGTDVEGRGLPQDAESSRERWSEYFVTQRKALESRAINSNILTHPVRLSVSTPVYPNEIGAWLYDLASIARDRGKALELNGKDLQLTPELVRKVAQACSKAGCKVSFGSDAHTPEQVSRSYDTASKLISEFKLQVV